LTDTGLLDRNGSGLWHLTPAGRLALETGAVVDSAEERRTFVFVDNSSLDRPTHFLPLEPNPDRSGGTPSPEGAGFLFSPSSLEASIGQTSEWKRCFRFPQEVEALLMPQVNESPEVNWRRVVLDAVEERLVVFIQTTQRPKAPTLIGFSVRPEGWTMEPEPLLELAEGWEKALPDLAAEPSPEMWRQAWQTWSHPRGLPLAEVAACRLERVDHRLLVHAPTRLIDRLRAARSDAVKQEAWLLAGEGRTRLAALIDLQPL
jgi:hypothetical protein